MWAYRQVRATSFMTEGTIPASGPNWSEVKRRTTRSAVTGEVLEDLWFGDALMATAKTSKWERDARHNLKNGWHGLERAWQDRAREDSDNRSSSGREGDCCGKGSLRHGPVQGRKVSFDPVDKVREFENTSEEREARVGRKIGK